VDENEEEDEDEDEDEDEEMRKSHTFTTPSSPHDTHQNGCVGHQRTSFTAPVCARR
jgi:hypothetical protein